MSEETDSHWIELRDTHGNKLHGRFDCGRQLLEVQRDRHRFTFDLRQTAERGFPVIVSTKTLLRGGRERETA